MKHHRKGVRLLDGEGHSSSTKPRDSNNIKTRSKIQENREEKAEKSCMILDQRNANDFKQ